MPEKYIDLHLHSNASDGTYPPAEVYRRASGAGLSAFALTDHDSLEGYDEIVGQVDADLIELIPAIELSGYWKGEDLHILAYLVDPESPELREKLAQFKTNREKRAEAMVEKNKRNGRPAGDGVCPAGSRSKHYRSPSRRRGINPSGSDKEL